MSSNTRSGLRRRAALALAVGLAALLIALLIGPGTDKVPVPRDPSCLSMLSQAEAEKLAKLDGTGMGFQGATVVSSVLLSWAELAQREPGMSDDSPNCVWWVTMSGSMYGYRGMPPDDTPEPWAPHYISMSVAIDAVDGDRRGLRLKSDDLFATWTPGPPTETLTPGVSPTFPSTPSIPDD
jgi:hypothetical protein